MNTEREISTIKLLGITILMTVSSCVSVSANFSPEQLSRWGVDLESTVEGNHEVARKATRTNSTRTSQIQKLIKSGRENQAIKKLHLDHSPVVVQIQPEVFHLSLLNETVTIRKSIFSGKFCIQNYPARAGPFCI